jgi:hypothetical protein
MTLTSFLGAKGFFLPNDNEDYWPDMHNNTMRLSMVPVA